MDGDDGMDSPTTRENKQILQAFVLVDDLNVESSPDIELPKKKTIKIKSNLDNQ